MLFSLTIIRLKYNIRCLYISLYNVCCISSSKLHNSCYNSVNVYKSGDVNYATLLSDKRP